MTNAIKTLDDSYIEFICKECNVTENELYNMDDDELYDRVYDAMCEIEIAETPIDGESESEHCKMAAHIVTILGNTFADLEELFDDPEDE